MQWKLHLHNLQDIFLIFSFPILNSTKVTDHHSGLCIICPHFHFTVFHLKQSKIAVYLNFDLIFYLYYLVGLLD